MKIYKKSTTDRTTSWTEVRVNPNIYSSMIGNYVYYVIRTKQDIAKKVKSEGPSSRALDGLLLKVS